MSGAYDNQVRLTPQDRGLADGAFWTYAETSRLKAIRTVLHGRRFVNMLDVGCGRGEFTVALALDRGVAKPHGVDFSSGALLEAERRGVISTKVDVNRESLPFSDGAFDLAVMIESIEHLEDVEHCLQEVARVVRPGGVLVVTTPNLAAWHGRLSLLLGFQPFTLDVGFRRHYGSIITFSGRSTGHIRGFTLPALREILEEFHFRVETVGSSPVPIPGNFPGKTIVSATDRVLSKIPSLASGLVVACSRTRLD